MKSSFLLSFFSASLLFLCACSPTCKNLTPPQAPQNPSHTYSMRMAANVRAPHVIENSIEPSITINGATHPMRKDRHQSQVFYYDYRMPEGQNHVSYYYTLTYKTKQQASVKTHTHTSNLYKFEPINRYIHALEYDRGPVGSEVTLSGRGFTKEDVIKLGDCPVPTQVVSPSLIRFTVPLLEADRAYPVRIENSNSSLHLGSFYIDGSSLIADRDLIELNRGETISLKLRTDAHPLPLDILFSITTDIPEAIAVEGLTLKAGQTEASLSLKGLSRGQGTLYIEAKGFKELALPLTIIDSASPHKPKIVEEIQLPPSPLEENKDGYFLEDMEDSLEDLPSADPVPEPPLPPQLLVIE